MAGALTAAIAAAFSGGGSPPVTTDEYFEYTTLLLPGNGTNGAQNNTFLDGSTNNFTITRNGNTTQGTFSPFSQTGWGNYFDGTGDYLSVPANAAFQLGTGDFSIEAWIYPTTTPGGQYPVVIRLESGGYNSNGLTLFWRRYNVNPNGVSVDCGGVVALAGTSTVALNTWTHVAVTRTGTTFALFVNGTREATTTSSNNFSVNDSVYIGDGTSDTEFPGYISNVRIVKGSNVYGVGTTLTVPTAPLTAISGTSLLTCQSNRFIDNSGNNFTVTPAGNASVQAFSPFNPTASWSAATYGGSGYFDGSGDYLSAASNTALNLTGDYTVECWFYANSFPTQPALFGIGSDAAGLVLTIVSSKVYAYFVGVGNVFGSGGTTLITNSWNHIAIVRSGTTNTCYINGSQSGTTYSSSSTISSTGGVGIGRTVTGSSFNDWNGYISNFRIVKGTAVYTGNFTPPTAPLTAITNTSLLLNFTNAGINDATSKNDLETVGNAQISTTQSKWGGSSMSFDGTGDYLITSPSIVNSIGTGDFTIEFWCYPTNTTAAYRAIVASENYNSTAGGWSIYQNGTGIEIYLTGGAIVTAASQLVASTWQHIALVRSGSATNNCKLYVNGTNVASATNTADWTGQRIFIGDNNYPGTDYFFNGYIQDLRITKNYARYTANFTPPTAAFPTL